MPTDRSQLLETAERRAFVLRQRRRGVTYRDIAQLAILKFGRNRLPNNWDYSYAHKDVTRELAKLRTVVNEEATDVLNMTLSRYDAMLDAIWDRVLDGQPEYIDRAIKIEVQRAKLLGLESAARLEMELTGKVEVDDHRSELQRKLSTIAERRKASGVSGEPDTD